jgi:predicted nucleic acid-binding protein
MPLKYLLDTSVFSQPLRPQPHPGCQRRWQKIGDARLAIPAMAIAEVEYGLFQKSSDRLWSAYRSILKNRLHVFDFTAPVASVFGEIKSKQIRTGKTVDDFDLAIAAVAITHDLTLVTLNTRHFRLIEELKWEDWS